MTFAYFAAFGAAACYGFGSVLQDISARQVKGTDHLDPKGLVKVTTRLPYVVGLGFDLLGWLLVLVALQSLPLFAVQAISASSIGVTVLLAAWLLDTQPDRDQMIVIAIMGVGLVSLAISAAPGDPHHIGDGFTLAVWLCIPIVAAFGMAAPRLASGDRAAALLGVVSGLGYGGTAVCARALEVDGTLGGALADPLTWALVPYGILGIAFFAAALQRGSVAIAESSQYAAEAVVPSLIGLIFLGDRARLGFGPLAVLGFTVTVGAAVALALVSHDDGTSTALAEG